MKRSVGDNGTCKKKFKESTQELGVILSICLQNFMCHDHLKFDFDPHVNFIIGQNGSGKSAILTGIILALGGKSSVTGRYSNIKGFIKTHKNKARISVTLKNCGECAYKPDLYGEKVIVEREITAEGSSSYKLKSEEGKIVSNSKEELTNILNAMDIQIDNPVLVLTQETSRNFLMAKTGKEEKLYEFFYRGTGLQKLEENYQHSITLKDAAISDLGNKKQALDVMEKEVKKLKKLSESQERVTQLRRESQWARIIRAEKELEDKVNEKAKLCKRIDTYKDQINKNKDAYNAVVLELEQCSKERAKCEEKLAVERKAISELGAQQDICASNVRRCQGQVDLFKREERKMLEDIHVITEAIKEHQRKDQTDFENEKQQRIEQIARLEAENENAAAQQQQLRAEHDKLLNEQNSMQKDIEWLKSEKNDLSYKKTNFERQLNQLRNAGRCREGLFGEHTSSILAEIKRRRREFVKLPRGPVGLHIEVKDPKWNNAVEACLKYGILRSYCCDNSKDSALLTQILQKYYPNSMPTVMTSTFLNEVHDVSRHKAKTNFPTILDMLKIKDPVIANCLIDQAGIENRILIEDITTAQNVMLDNPPHQCSSAFLLNCDEILLNPYRHYSATSKPRNLLTQNVTEDHFAKIGEDIANIDDQIKRKEADLNDIWVNLQSLPPKIKNLETGIVKLDSKIRSNVSHIHELQQYEEPRNVPEMHEEYTSLQADLEKKQKELQDAVKNLTMHENKRNEITEKLNHQKELVTNAKNEYDLLGSKANKCAKNKEYLAVSQKEFESSLKNDERCLQQAELEIENNKADLQRATEKATEICPRINTTRSYEELDLRISEMEQVVSEKSHCPRGTVLEKYQERNRRLLEAKTEYKLLERQNNKLSGMLLKREKKFIEILKYSQKVLDMAFIVILKYNGFKGRLNFKQCGLRLEATPRQDGSETGGKKNCSSLSGGERSYVTISFLLALWERIKMPFRILDEYDVFMDSNNRNLSINLLIKHAIHHMKSVQFIFLSPLELPEMNHLENIKVHKMPAPKRIGLSNMEED